jgi:reverse gyrase
MKTSQCHNCGGEYPDEMMADWTICRNCMQDQVGEDKYIDSLGIVWSKEELEEAGGEKEVELMCEEADIRKNNSFKTL